jgi:hypothetical protein
MYFMGLSKADRKKLETEVVSNAARLKLTRLVRQRCEIRHGDGDGGNIEIINRNQMVNTARTVLGLPIYRLEPDDMGMYMSEEFAWHAAETELIMRRPDTPQLVETLGDMLEQGMLNVDAVNTVLSEDNSSVRFEAKGFDENVSVKLLSDITIEEESEDADHPNIRLLIERMEGTFEKKDYAGVLHASATVFETLAKVVFHNPDVEKGTLGAIFEGYRKRSELPEPLLDYILDTYRWRNTEPLAGHGATKEPSVTAKDASVLIEITKMCVRLERRLATQEIDGIAQVPNSAGAPPPPKPPAASNRREKRKAAKPRSKGRS